MYQSRQITVSASVPYGSERNVAMSLAGSGPDCYLG